MKASSPLYKPTLSSLFCYRTGSSMAFVGERDGRSVSRPIQPWTCGQNTRMGANWHDMWDTYSLRTQTRSSCHYWLGPCSNLEMDSVWFPRNGTLHIPLPVALMFSLDFILIGDYSSDPEVISCHWRVFSATVHIEKEGKPSPFKWTFRLCLPGSGF